MEERSKVYAAPVGQSLRALEGKRKQELEEIEEKKKKPKGNDGKSNQTAQFVAAREAQIKKLKEQEQIIRRRKLNLPVPQVGERELEDIVKIGQAGESARDLVTGGTDATGRLLGDYESLGQARMTRTPRTIQGEDTIMAESRNLRNMTATQTPLLGQENTPLHGQQDGTGFESATPRHGIAATPNPLATPARGPLSTARTIGATPARTPIRDNLSINDGDSVYSAYGETPRDEKRRLADARRALKAGFASLPKPENNFELADDEEEVEEDEEIVLTEEDAAERDARLKAARELEERLEMERRSTVVKRGLPRPANVNPQSLFASLNETVEDLTPEVKMINAEMANLMRHDSLAHPIPGTSTPGVQMSEYDMPEDEFVASAKSAIHAELAAAIELPGANEEQVRLVIGSSIDESVFQNDWAAERAGLVYSPSTSTWVDSASLTPPDLAEAYQYMIQQSRDRMISEATKAAKAEKKLSKQLGGYQALNAKARSGINDAIQEIQAAQRDLETFNMLRVMEEAAAPSRLEKKREEVAALERRERDLQARYAEMNDERRELQESNEQVSRASDRELSPVVLFTPALSSVVEGL